MRVDDRYRTRAQKEWSDWAAHGYRKTYQPRSVRRFGAVFAVCLAALIVAVVVSATRGLR